MQFRVELVKAWKEEPIVELYQEGGWWKEHMDPSRIGELISQSFLFAMAIDSSTGRSLGMRRVISDGIADAYIQDVVVLAEWRRRGVGRMILSALLEGCMSRGIAWISLISQPGTDAFYRALGFVPMVGSMPMQFQGK